MHLPRRFAVAGPGKWALVTALVLVLGGGSYAMASGEGSALLAGKRNPRSGLISSETTIIAKTGGYATRQSNFNHGSGGGAIYGCRSNPGTQPCIRANNLTSGRAFEFATKGSEGGFIQVDGANAKPFTTNAHGVATGLNADQVDGQSATDIVGSALAANPTAQVKADGTLLASRGVTGTVSHTAASGKYTLTFSKDISKCTATATQTDLTDPGVTALAPQSATTIQVDTHGGAAAGALADRPFNLVVTC
ncbi:MAG: hypothetical protein JWN32_2206 [Solirubrobacterales bacterium]|jgi:hypothetical protein|nr:hypothetical protein [Solirubrobacterales bacterium]